MKQFSLLSFILASHVLAQGEAQVKVEHGDVIGEFLPSGVRQWMGIPFAQSPPERFALPVDPKPWKSPLKATKASPSCFGQIDCELCTEC
jgi:carboxylesterase type B